MKTLLPLVLALILGTTCLHAVDRVALVIGNSSYPGDVPMHRIPRRGNSSGWIAVRRM